MRQVQFFKFLTGTLIFLKKLRYRVKQGKEKKFISPIPCIREKFRLQKVGVVAVFYTKKWCQIFILATFQLCVQSGLEKQANFIERGGWLGFWFWALFEKIYLVVPSLSKFFSQGGRSRIQLNLVSHTLLALVSYPHPLLASHS